MWSAATRSTTRQIERRGDLIENKSNGAMEHHYSVFSPERLIAIVMRGGDEPRTKYLHTDHLGSTNTCEFKFCEIIKRYQAQSVWRAKPTYFF